LIEIGSKTLRKTAQTDRQTNRHYENNGHLAVNQKNKSILKCRVDCGVGREHGRRAVWVNASADQTFVRIDESLINVHTLNTSTVIANQSAIGLSLSLSLFLSVCLCLSLCLSVTVRVLL